MTTSHKPISIGYSRASIILHWITAIAVLALFITHEGERGSAMRSFHIGAGSVIGLIILWRAVRRLARGMPQKVEQHASLTLLSHIVIWGLVINMLVVIITGYMVPWSGGRSIDIYGLIQLPSPLARSHDLHEIFEEIHELSGKLFIPLVGLHILGALKHWIFNRDIIMGRMFKVDPDSRR